MEAFMLEATEVGGVGVGVWQRCKLCVGVDGLRWCWQRWRDQGLHVVTLVLMEMGGVRFGAMELWGILVGSDGLALVFVLASCGDGGERH